MKTKIKQQLKVVDFLNEELKAEGSSWATYTPLEKAVDGMIAAEYNLYLAACLEKNVKPSLKVFFSGKPDRVIDVMEYAQNEMTWARMDQLKASV